jgi:hypothetical protein
MAARGVHYLHRPGPLLQDLGFMALPVCCLVFLLRVNELILDTDCFRSTGGTCAYDRNLAEREVLLVRVYSLPCSFPLCW